MPSAADLGRRWSAGFTLVEALVATTVLAVGLIGVVAMLLRGLQASRFAAQRSQAIVIAADMAERIRAGRIGANAFELAAGVTLGLPGKACDGSVPCTSAEAIAVELYSWQQWAWQALPNAQVAVTNVPATAPGTRLCTITVTWSQGGDASDASFVLVLQV